jgi:hypothetical protein
MCDGLAGLHLPSVRQSDLFISPLPEVEALVLN